MSISCRPTWRGRARSGSLPVESVDTLVIGGGVVGSCVAYWLAREGIEAMVVERDEPNLQASGANAGSLHVQMLSFDFGANARRRATGRPTRCRSAGFDRVVAGDRARHRPGPRDQGRGRIDGRRDGADVEFLKAKIAERSRGIEAELIGANELRQLEPAIGDVAIAAEWCRAKARSTRCAAPTPRSPAPSLGRPLPARQQRSRHRARRYGLARDHEPRRLALPAHRQCLGPLGGRDRPPGRARFAGARARPLQMIATEPMAPTLTRLVAHAARHLTPEADGLGRLPGGRRLDGRARRAAALSRQLRSSVEGNLWVAARVVPALAELHAVRIWAGMNVNIDRAPILGEAPRLPGFYNCVGSNGYTLAPVLARLTAEMLADGRPASPWRHSCSVASADRRKDSWKPRTSRRASSTKAIKTDPNRRRFGFGRKPALVNVDLQNAYTRPAEFVTAYETDPKQIDHVNALARLCRRHGCPVIWTYVSYLDSGEGLRRGTRSDTSVISLQNIRAGSRRSSGSTIAARSTAAPTSSSTSAPASAFFETNLASLLTFIASTR